MKPKAGDVHALDDLISQSHDKRNCNVEAAKILRIESSNPLANALTAYRDRFIGHYLGA